MSYNIHYSCVHFGVFLDLSIFIHADDNTGNPQKRNWGNILELLLTYWTTTS